jgi:hypothetical protein
MKRKTPSSKAVQTPGVVEDAPGVDGRTGLGWRGFRPSMCAKLYKSHQVLGRLAPLSERAAAAIAPVAAGLVAGVAGGDRLGRRWDLTDYKTSRVPNPTKPNRRHSQSHIQTSVVAERRLRFLQVLRGATTICLWLRPSSEDVVARRTPHGLMEGVHQSAGQLRKRLSV